MESATPMSREEIINYVKENGMMNDSWHDFNTNPDNKPEMILGCHVLNESDARCYIVNLSGHIIIYVENKIQTP